MIFTILNILLYHIIQLPLLYLRVDLKRNILVNELEELIVLDEVKLVLDMLSDGEFFKG